MPKPEPPLTRWPRLIMLMSRTRRQTCSVELLLFLYLFGLIFALLHRHSFLHGLVLSLTSFSRPEKSSWVSFFEPWRLFKLLTLRIQDGSRHRFMHALGGTVVKHFLLSNLPLICGVNLLNPWPSYRFPCGECQKPCKSNQKAIFSDGYSICFHPMCQSLSDEQYFQLGL